VREIFSLATTGDTRDPSLPVETDGLTLDELQRIGEEAGIEPARVARAVERIDARGKPTPVRRSFGLPVGMSRLVDLPRAPTDREREQLIATVRTTSGAQGRATTSGGLREWSQGDLHISVEPNDHGEQLRLSTRDGHAEALNALAQLLCVMSVLLGVTAAAAGKPGKAIVVLGLFVGLALGTLGANLVRSRRWARERERQLEALTEHAVKLLSDS